jgi:hypothetical protein
MALIDFLTNPTNAAEMISLVTSLCTVTRKQAGYWSLFSLFLIITLVIEGAGFYYRAILKQPNYPFYNFLMIVQVLFYSFLYNKFMPKRQTRFVLFMVAGLFLFFFISEGVSNSFTTYNTYSRQFLSAFIVIFSCIFYFSILKRDDIENPVKYPPFWVVTGLFFYYFGTITMFAFYPTVSKIKFNGGISFYTLVIGSLSCILYGSWIIAFLCHRKQIRISSTQS